MEIQKKFSIKSAYCLEMPGTAAHTSFFFCEKAAVASLYHGLDTLATHPHMHTNMQEHTLCFEGHRRITNILKENLQHKRYILYKSVTTMEISGMQSTRICYSYSLEWKNKLNSNLPPC